VTGGRHTAIPQSVLSAFLGLVPVGIVIGALYGLDVISLLALDLVVLGGLAVFVPWAVLKLDPRGLSEFGEKSDK
jgi:hypothetical protein